MADKQTVAELMAELARIKAENDGLKAKVAARQHFTLKVSEKGALSIYGMSRFPVTLYRGQWETIFSHLDDIKAFITTNNATLKVKE